MLLWGCFCYCNWGMEILIMVAAAYLFSTFCKNRLAAWNQPRWGKNIMEIDKCQTWVWLTAFLNKMWIRQIKKSVHLLSFHSSFRKHQKKKPFCRWILHLMSVLRLSHLYLHLHFFIFFSWLKYILYKMGNKCLIQHFKLFNFLSLSF